MRRVGVWAFPLLFVSFPFLMQSPIFALFQMHPALSPLRSPGLLLRCPAFLLPLHLQMIGSASFATLPRSPSSAALCTAACVSCVQPCASIARPPCPCASTLPLPLPLTLPLPLHLHPHAPARWRQRSCGSCSALQATSACSYEQSCREMRRRTGWRVKCCCGRLPAARWRLVCSARATSTAMEVLLLLPLLFAQTRMKTFSECVHDDSPLQLLMHAA